MVDIVRKEWQVRIHWLDRFTIDAEDLERDNETEVPFKQINIKELLGPKFVKYKIQTQAWLIILNDDGSLFLPAGTGAGKTESIFVPVLDILLENKNAHILIMIPTKALSQDLDLRFRKMASNSELTIQLYNSSVSRKAKAKIRNKPREIMIITPDTLMGSIIGTRNEDWYEYLTRPSMIWIDEFHATSGTLGTALCYLIRSLYILDPSLRVFFTSATLPNTLEIASLFPFPSSIISGGSRHGEIQFHIGTIRDFEKVLDVMVRDDGQFLIFIENKRKIEDLITKIKSGGIDRYHADLPDNERHLILSKFSQNQLDGLLCTSAISLGIDIPGVKNIVFYGFPRSFSLLFQEMGRGTRDYNSRGNVYLLLDESKLIDLYYKSHLEELKRDINTHRSEPVIIDLLNKKILQGMVLFAIKLGLDTLEKLKENFQEAHNSTLLEQIITWLFIKGLITKNGDKYEYFKEAADEFLLDFIKNLRPGFPKFKIWAAQDGREVELGYIGAENIPYRACKGNYYIKEDKRYFIKEIDSNRGEIHVVQSKEHYISKNLVSSVVSLVNELKFKKYLDLGIRLADFKVQVRPKMLRNYENSETSEGTLIIEEKPSKYGGVFELNYETKGLLIEFAPVQNEPLNQMVLYQLAMILLQNARVMINVSENEVDCFQHHERRMLYFLDRSCPTGVSQQLYENIEEILLKTYQVLTACVCKGGCEKCSIPLESNFLQPNFNSNDIYRKEELLALLRRCLHESGSLE